MRHGRAGLSLLELVLAVALLALLTLSLLQLLSTGTRSAARGTEMQLATELAARLVDRLSADGFSGLLPVVGREVDVDLTGVLADPRTGSGQHSVVVDNLEYTARCRVAELRPGLLSLRVRVSWQRVDPGRSAPGALEVVRYLADPEVALAPTGGEAP